MDDIARAADMSRPALYLLFKNKTDIYRAIAADAARQFGRAGAGRRLSAEGSLRRAYDAAMIEACLIAMMQTIAESPHGAEILDMKSSLAGDLACDWRSRLEQHRRRRRSTSEAAAQRRRSRRARPFGEGLADMLLDGLEGMKMRLSDPGEQRKAARGLVTRHRTGD